MLRRRIVSSLDGEPDRLACPEVLGPRFARNDTVWRRWVGDGFPGRGIVGIVKLMLAFLNFIIYIS